MSPTISIVTPSYNQGAFLEQTLRSVLDEQTSPPDEYVVIDGDSTDGSREILERWSGRLTYSVSEPDEGQHAAINKGFTHTTGEVLAWLNSDDRYTPWALQVVRELFDRFPQIEWLTTLYPLAMDERGVVSTCTYGGPFAAGSFLRGGAMPWGAAHSSGGVQQESTFWRRPLWERAGGRIDPSLHYAGDFDLWSRFFRHADLYAVEVPLGIFRVHGAQKTTAGEPYQREAQQSLDARGAPGRPAANVLRAALVRVLGRRPLGRLPALVAGPLVAARLLHPAPVVLWRDGDWRISTDYVV
ncbi:MAG TPA: glycosyltransferase family 2 protein [Gaiellaceae bacterium]|nr:glycosyltransferase family 2 protein [Gaiellaceae bacterium]